MEHLDRPSRQTPHITDRERDIFEQAYQSDNLVVQASVSIDMAVKAYNDSTLKSIHKGILQAADTDTEEATIHAAIKHGVLALEKFYENGIGTWNDYFRLRAQLHSFSETASATTAFMMYDEFDRRRNIMNGAAGRNIEVIEEILKTYTDIREATVLTDYFGIGEHSRTELDQLAGALSESTIMALVNYSQTPSKLAVPAGTYNDLRDKTDMYYYYTDDKKRAAFRTPVQIKTTRPSKWVNGEAVELPDDDKRIRRLSPANGFTLFLSDYDPSGVNHSKIPPHDRFRLAKLLVAQHAPEDLSPIDEAFIQTARIKLETNIKELRERYPGEQLPYLRAAPNEVAS